MKRALLPAEPLAAVSPPTRGRGLKRRWAAASAIPQRRPPRGGVD